MKVYLRVASRALFLVVVCAIPLIPQQRDAYDEPWRPQYHFTPPKNFMNDPNGLVFYKGEYHLFYQYNPQGTEWGHMSWGHAVSKDMLHWKNLPVAIPEEPGKFMIYSGSAVVDWHNSSGLCTSGGVADPACLIAVYTAAAANSQSQNIAVSNDRGRTWKNYSGNPVADLHHPDFRDPKVFWYAAQQKWVMAAVLADEREVVFLDSKDLKSWVLRGSFTSGENKTGQWECPDLFELPVDGNLGEKKWVLVVNRNPGAPAGGTGVEYFIGSFDGARFVSESPSSRELWADYGKDFYATNSYSDIPASDGRRIWIGWISNWQYANREPTAVWRGAQSLPRSLILKRFPDGLRLVQQPIAEAKQLRDLVLLHISNESIPAAIRAMKAAGIEGETLEVLAELAPDNANEIGFQLRKGPKEETILGFEPAKHEIYFDRTRSGSVAFSNDFPGRFQASVSDAQRIRLHIFMDRSSVETFVNDGEVVMTNRIYPSPASNGVGLYSADGRGSVVSLSIWKLRSVWR